MPWLVASGEMAADFCGFAAPQRREILINTKMHIEISVGSSTQFEDLIAEIIFGEYFGLIVSQESGEGAYEVTAHSITPSGVLDFQYGRSPAGARVSLSEFTEALESALQRLKELQRQSGTDPSGAV